MKVEQVMTASPACCMRDDFVQVAANIMKRFDTGIVPVTEKLEQHSRLVGVVTDRDLCLGVLADGRDPNTLRVSELMSTHLAVCKPAETVDLALARMKRAKVRRIPVVNSDFEVVGLLSLGDIVRRKAARESEIVRTLAAISAPQKKTGARKKAA